MSRNRSAAAVQVPAAAPVFAALGDTTRLGLLRRLSADGPLSITRLSAGTGVTRQAITRHLQALGAAGLVRDLRRGRGRGVFFGLERVEVAERYLDSISPPLDAAGGRL